MAIGRNLTSISVIAIASVAVASAASAQTESAAGSESGIGLEEIVVTAQKRSENLQRVPIAITAVTNDSLLAAGVDNGTSLSRVTPNLVVTTGQGSYSPYLRGVGVHFPTLGLESSVATYFDDQYMSRPTSGLNTFNDIARIEVLKGPQGTLFGRNAAGGAVRFITNDPTQRFEARGALTYGRFDRIAAEAVVNVPLTDTLAARVAYAHDERDGFVRNIDPSKVKLNNRNVDLIRGKLLWQPTENFKVRISGDYSTKNDFESDVFLPLGDAPTQLGVAVGGLPSPGFYVTTEDYPAKPNEGYVIHQGGASVRADLDLGALTLSSISGWRYAYFFSRAADTDAVNLPLQHNNFKESSDSYSQEFQAVSNGNGPFNYVVGFYYYREVGGNNFNLFGSFIDQLFGVPSGPNVGVPSGGAVFGATSRLKIESLAPYAQASYDLSDQWQILVGGRYTSEKKTLVSNNVYADIPGFPRITTFTENDTNLKFNKFTPKVTLSFRPAEKILLYASYSVGFKSGGINTPSVAKADTVKPETLKSYELGWKSELGDIRFNGSAFYYDLKDLQVQRVDQATGGLRIENAANAEIYGIEVDLTWAPTSKLELGSSLGYLKTKYKNYNGVAFVPCFQNPGATGCGPTGTGNLGYGTLAADLSGNRVANTPKLTFNVRGEYTQPLSSGRGRLRFNTAVSYSSSYFYNPENNLSEGSYTIVNAGITWQSESGKYEFGVFGDNLLDTKYNALKVRQNLGGWRVPAAPVTWGIRLGVSI